MLPRTLHTSIALSVLFAVLLTVTVPHFCATGWCCSKHQEQSQTAEKPSCCATKVEVQKSTGDTCCGTKTPAQKSNSKHQGCATGCCRIAATPYMLTAPVSAQVIPPVSALVAGTITNTGIELSDYIPQPPRVLSV